MNNNYATYPDQSTDPPYQNFDYNYNNNMNNTPNTNDMIPINNPIIFPVFSLSLNRPIKHGMIINKVHHPSKKILISAIPSALAPIISPSIISTIPHNMFPNFFIFYPLSLFLFF